MRATDQLKYPLSRRSIVIGTAAKEATVDRSWKALEKTISREWVG